MADARYIGVSSWWKARDSFQPGDVVEFQREDKYYHHWGLYLGNDLVAHATSEEYWNSDTSRSASAPGASPPNELFVQRRAKKYVVCENLLLEQTPSLLGKELENRTKWYIKIEDISHVAGNGEFRVHNIPSGSPETQPRSLKEIIEYIRSQRTEIPDPGSDRRFVLQMKFKKPGIISPNRTVPVMLDSGGRSAQVDRVILLGKLALCVALVIIIFLAWYLN